MKNFKTYQLAVEFYRHAAAVPLSGHLRNQLHRAASSIALNLAEGRGKGSAKDQKRFFRIAFGSLRESQAALELAQIEDKKLVELADKLAAHLYKLIKS